MKLIFFLLTLGLSVSVCADMVDTSGFSVTADKRLNDLLENEDLEFRLPDQTGTGVSFSSYFNKREIYLYSFLPSCRAKEFMVQFKKMKSTKTKAAHLLINSEIQADRRGLEASYPNQSILIDINQQVSNSLFFKNSGDYVVFDSKNQKVTKVGSLFGKKALPKECQIPFVTYSKDSMDFRSKILPALARSCISCHVGNTDLSYFQSIEKIRSWKNMMLRTIRLNRMPPGADPYYSHLDSQMSTQDLFEVTKWLEAGAPASEEDSALYEKYIKKNGKGKRNLDDLKKAEELVLFSSIEEKVSATGGDFYKHYKTKEKTTKDYYFVFFEVGVNPRVAHHMALHHSLEPFPEVDLKGSAIDGSKMVLYGNNRVPTTGSYHKKPISAFKFQDPNIIHISRTSGIGFAPP